MIEWVLFGGCLLALGALVAVLVLCRTFLYGLNAMNLFYVSSATISAYFVGFMFNLPLDWITPEHRAVLSYSIVGLMAMALGILVAWRPLVEAQRQSGGSFYVPQPIHFNQDVGWLTFWVGVAAEIAFPFVYNIPTVSTAVYCVSALARIGLCILLVNALGRRRWGRFALAALIFAILSVANSLVSGFTFIRLNLLLPMIVIWLVFSGFTWRTVTAACVLLLASVSAVNAWLRSRLLIRSGMLENLPLADKAEQFFKEYFANLEFPSPEMLQSTVLERVDMTDILAAQVGWQPTIEPYAHGDTLLSSLYTLIPRAIWAEKPEVAGGSAFVARFTGIDRPIEDPTSVGLPYPFELYANGGPLVVVIGLAVIGYVCARLELKLVSPQASLGGFWALALVTATLCEGGQRSDVVLPALVASGLTAFVLGSVTQRFWLGGADFRGDHQNTKGLRKAGAS